MKEKPQKKYPRPPSISAVKEREILEYQCYLCALCGTQLKSAKYPDGKKRCHDHDHITGKTRGFLCTKCNTTLGAVGDNVPEAKATLERAIAYLTRAEGPWKYNGKMYTIKTELIYAYLDDDKVFVGDTIPPNLEEARKNIPFFITHGDYGARLNEYCNKIRTDQTGQYTIGRVLLKSGKCGRVYILPLTAPVNKETHGDQKTDQKEGDIQVPNLPSTLSGSEVTDAKG